ncbi:DgyrCDS2705 [Dimorphilus gyrociliatus]|uniref:Mediator of RNA polymerase II transcription subunit 9 n=1 Tax=Dimorphilus gyrociliatus TaxID=2664684 RepID=A0A7I8VB28_9ANNE|nr:DgyrCDS2705 [Dimorphilus gyrociliatus]
MVNLRKLSKHNYRSVGNGNISLQIKNMSDVDVNFIPLVYEILKSVDKDSGDVTNRVTDLKNKIQRAKEQVEKLPGIDQCPEEQAKQLEVIRKQLDLKVELLKKLRNFSITPLSNDQLRFGGYDHQSYQQ